jgi:hypothetical protein
MDWLHLIWCIGVRVSLSLININSNSNKKVVDYKVVSLGVGVELL